MSDDQQPYDEEDNYQDYGPENQQEFLDQNDEESKC